MNNKQKKNKKYTPWPEENLKEKTERAYKYFKHADDHYAQRINFFLVAESMLVISFVTSLTNSSILPEIGLAISIIGLIFTSIWLYTNARLEIRTIYMIKNHLKKDDLYREYLTSTGGWFSKSLLTYTLPISMNLLWIFFICYQLQIKNPFLGAIIIFSFVLLVIIGSLMNKLLPNRITDNDDVT